MHFYVTSKSILIDFFKLQKLFDNLNVIMH